MNDPRDLVIEQLADDEAALLSALLAARADRDAYRLLACVTLEQLHATTEALARTRRLLPATRETLAQPLGARSRGRTAA